MARGSERNAEEMRWKLSGGGGGGGLFVVSAERGWSSIWSWSHVCCFFVSTSSLRLFGWRVGDRRGGRRRRHVFLNVDKHREYQTLGGKRFLCP